MKFKKGKLIYYWHEDSPTLQLLAFMLLLEDPTEGKERCPECQNRMSSAPCFYFSSREVDVEEDICEVCYGVVN